MERESLRRECEESAQILDDLWRDTESVAGQLSSFESQSRTCQEDIQRKETRLGALRMELLEAVQETAALRNQVTQLDGFLEATERQIEQTKAQHESAEFSRAGAAAWQEECGTRLQQRQAEAARLAEERRTWEESLRLSREEETQLRGHLEEVRGQLSADRARQASLEDIL